MASNGKLSAKLMDNINELNERFFNCPDIIKKEVILKESKKGCFVFIKDYVDVSLIQRDYMRPIMNMNYSILISEDIIKYLPLLNVSLCYDMDALVTEISMGKTIFLVDGAKFAVASDIVDVEKRALSEPENEKNVRGTRDCFIESLGSNINMLRKKIKNNNLKFKSMVLGNIANQNLRIAYIEGIANPELVNTLYKKLNSIDIDAVTSLGYVEQYLSEFKYSPFPQYMATERPDKAVAALLEGKIGILFEGSPAILFAPISLFSFFHSPDDYNSGWIFGTFIRLVRFLGIITALLLPGLYISVTSFQYYLVPLNLLIPLAQSRVRVAFPPIVEAMLMEFTITMLREASIRLPTYIGNTVGVVGGIIIGQAAVNAGIVSNLFIIIVAITAVASYIVPNYEFGLTIVVLRIAFLLVSSVFGMVGLISCMGLLLMHLMELTSLGQPYLLGFWPLKLSNLKYTIIRAPIQYMRNRPNIAKPVRKKRGAKNE